MLEKYILNFYLFVVNYGYFKIGNGFEIFMIFGPLVTVNTHKSLKRVCFDVLSI